MTTAELSKGDIVIPGSWGLTPLNEVPEVVEDAQYGARINIGTNNWISAKSANEAREYAQDILNDLYRMHAIQEWFETREEREREQVLHEFNADTEGNPLPHAVLVESLADEIIRLRKEQQ